MKIQVSEEQYRNLIKKVFGVDVLVEQEDTGDSAPKAGTSSDGEKKTNAKKWESGVTRGPANQVGVTKWSDIVGSSLKRGKANPLTETDLFEEPAPTQPPSNILTVNTKGSYKKNENYADSEEPPMYDTKLYNTKYNQVKQNPNSVEEVFPLPPRLKSDISQSKIITYTKTKDDLVRNAEKLNSEIGENKKYAPDPVYSLDENKYDFLEDFEKDKNEQTLNNYRNKNLKGVNTFKTFWGEDIQIDCDKFDVQLWKPDDNRSTIFKIENGKFINYPNYPVPPEYFLKSAFPNYTISTIIDKNTKEKYSCWLTYKNVNNTLPPPEPRITTAEKVKGTTWDIIKGAAVTTVFVGTGGLALPVYNYFYGNKKQDPRSKYTPSWVPNLEVGYGKKVDKGGGKYDIIPFQKEIKVDNGYRKIYYENKYHVEYEAYRIKALKSNSGKEVPKGYDPNRYDEYLEKIKPIQWRIFQNLKKSPEILQNLPSTQKTRTMGKSETEVPVDKSNEEIVRDYDSYFKNLKGSPIADQIKRDFEEIDKIYKSFRSPIGEGGVFEFSRGITPEERELYYKTKIETENFYNELNQFLKRGISILKNPISQENISTQEKTEREQFWMSYYYYYNDYKIKLSNLENEKNSKITQTNLIFGNDYWKPSVMGKGFDEWWDDWGTVVQILGNIALIVATGGLAQAFAAPALLRSLIPYAVDFGFNSLVAAYQSNRGQDEEALLSLICALVPIPKYALNVGRISEKTALELSEAIAKAEANTLRDPKLFEKFIAGLTDEQRYALRNVMSLPRSEIERVGGTLVKDIEEYQKAAKQLGVEIPGARKVGIKLFAKELGFEGLIPLGASLINGYLGLVKNSIRFELKPKEWLDLKQKLENEIKKIQGQNEEQKVSKNVLILQDLRNDPNLSKKLSNAKTYGEVSTVIISETNNRIKQKNNLTDEEIKKKFEEILPTEEESQEILKLINDGKKITNSNSG